MSSNRRHTDVLVVGAGPAGMAAAVTAAQSGARVTIVDDNAGPGGQIWRNEQAHPHTTQASTWFRKLAASGTEIIAGVRIISADVSSGLLLADTDQELFEIQYRKLVLATGGRELFLPFPGWTLPNVMGVGGLQAMVRSGLHVERKRIVVAGSGPLLLAAASYLREHGAVVPVIAEQASWGRLLGFGLRLIRHPLKLWQALRLRMSLGATPYRTGCWVEAAEGEDKVASVRLRRGRNSWTERCDYLAVAFGFVPNTELAALLGCRIERNSVWVNDLQQTSMTGIYCAGEATGVGGVDLALVEGEIAGYAATGNEAATRLLWRRRAQAVRFASALEQGFALRKQLRSLARAETVICRCEDVRRSRLESGYSWTSAKLHTRCGMGPCQGRVCGSIVKFLFGWTPESVRPPLFPALVGHLISEPIGPEGANI